MKTEIGKQSRTSVISKPVRWVPGLKRSKIQAKRACSVRRFFPGGCLVLFFLLLMPQSLSAAASGETAAPDATDENTYEITVNERGNEVLIITDEHGNEMTIEMLPEGEEEYIDDDWDVISVEDYEAAQRAAATGGEPDEAIATPDAPEPVPPEEVVESPLVPTEQEASSKPGQYFKWITVLFCLLLAAVLTMILLTVLRRRKNKPK